MIENRFCQISVCRISSLSPQKKSYLGSLHISEFSYIIKNPILAWKFHNLPKLLGKTQENWNFLRSALYVYLADYCKNSRMLPILCAKKRASEWFLCSVNMVVKSHYFLSGFCCAPLGNWFFFLTLVTFTILPDGANPTVF